MCRPLCLQKPKGFTLIEVLVVMVIMGLVVIAAMGLFIDNKKTSATTEEVVDVQQNLRIALETLVSDIRMAGFLIPADENPITGAPNIFGIDANRDGDLDDTDDVGNFFTLQTSSSLRAYARVVDEAFSTPTVTLEVEDVMEDAFASGQWIKVIRPSTLEDLSPGENWAVTAVDSGANTISATDTGAGGSYVSGAIQAGDMVVRKQNGEAYPAVVNYWLRPTQNAGTNNFELVRQDDVGASVVANFISAIDLTYLMEDGTESNAPAVANLDQIKAIRIVASAQTDNTKTGLDAYSGTKTRTLRTVVKIRNVMGD
ncbi:prepilin-type N-terminal cleavage/methylation domain-containing protein [Malonomonas rubra DSM 5091]|uniref:Prepilin-type N-terminal cleavage/methylation domain-containing protein n=1 Tax=Malonomonas rubra DSM 5091 TaxID=1122189 RepID=A0A1M6BM08_MALRU|nr:prepilin-type N-terminal cleavage/methylation domain-containing protein [Malonomonas rubra]SHI49578.1 prepilin-type N-terminal cleavage/methylation domain-containing protein [Malonomonas rubra DSM 5091]